MQKGEKKKIRGEKKRKDMLKEEIDHVIEMDLF